LIGELEIIVAIVFSALGSEGGITKCSLTSPGILSLYETNAFYGTNSFKTSYFSDFLTINEMKLPSPISLLSNKLKSDLGVP